MKIIDKVIPKYGGKTDLDFILASGGGLPSTLGAKYNAEFNTQYESRAAYPEFTGIITITSGNGQLEKNDSGSWGVAVSMAPGDYYRCRATSGPDYGDVVQVDVDLPDTFIITNRLKDETPDPFEFQDQTGVEPSTMTTSLPVILEGFDPDLPVSVENGEYDVNQDDNWLTAPSVIQDGDLIRVRRQSGDYSSMVGVEFTAGTESDIFNIVTRQKDETPDSFTFTDVSGVEPSTMTTSDPVTISGMDDGCPVSVASGEYDVNQSGTWLTDDGSINSGDQIRVRRSSGAYSSTVGVTFTAGDKSDTFNITAKDDPNTGTGAQRPDGGQAQRPDGEDAVLP